MTATPQTAGTAAFKRLLFTLALPAILLSPAAKAQILEDRVVSVVDGDTFDFPALRIRICGIEAPEPHEPGGAESALALNERIGGKRVHCVPVGAGTVCDGRSEPVNRGRVVAQRFVGGADIAAQMVRAGHACDWMKFSGGSYPGGCKK